MSTLTFLMPSESMNREMAIKPGREMKAVAIEMDFTRALEAAVLHALSMDEDSEFWIILDFIRFSQRVFDNRGWIFHAVLYSNVVRVRGMCHRCK